MKNGQMYFKDGKKYLIAESGSEILIPSGFIGDRIEAGKKYSVTYEVKEEKGITSISKMFFNGKTYPNYDNKQPNRNPNQFRNYQAGNNDRNQRNNLQDNIKPSIAPYNFIPLNKEVIYPVNQNVNFSKYENNNGYIEIEIENLTHLMISSGKDETTEIHDFLKIGKDQRPIIPGSSLRGLIKSTVEIISSSRLIEGDNYENKPLFYRGVADKAFRTLYQPLFFKGSHNDYKSQAGYLRKKGNGFEIIPAIDLCGTQYYKIRKTNQLGNAIPPAINSKKETVFSFVSKQFIPYSVERIYFLPDYRKLHNHAGRQLMYALVDDKNCSSTNNNGTLTEGTLVISGGMATKKHDQWIVNVKTSDPTLAKEISSKVIDDYKDDIQREENFDLLKKLENANNVPCFYLTDETGKIVSFGHTPLYRVKHSQEIRDAIRYDSLPDEKKYDYAQMLFGVLDKFSSRIYFEDSILQGTLDDLQIENFNGSGKPPLIKILASPKPTSHQLYLKQERETGTADKTWSSDNIKISGFKQYWHKKMNVVDWTDNEDNKSDSHAGYLKAIKPNKKFIGRIRFENLSDEELGALLLAIDLDTNCCHKIGMGKPYGLGTIQIKAKLHMIDRKNRYASLLSNSEDKWAWNISTAKYDDKNKNLLKDKFAKSVLSITQEDGATGKLWADNRLRQFKAMLEFDKNKPTDTSDWIETTRYMQIEHPENKNEYKNRAVLPQPLTVKESVKNKQ